MENGVVSVKAILVLLFFSCDRNRKQEIRIIPVGASLSNCGFSSCFDWFHG